MKSERPKISLSLFSVLKLKWILGLVVVQFFGHVVKAQKHQQMKAQEPQLQPIDITRPQQEQRR